MKIQTIIFTFFILFASLQNCLGQEKGKDISLLGISENATNCEMGAVYLDQLWNLWKDAPETKSFVIFIARLGKNETRREINLKRLTSIRNIFKTRYSDIPMQRVIFAEGEKINGLGRVEFYWNGELAGAILTGKNRNICVSCCD